MPEITNEQFLLSCINNSDLKKIDFAQVARDLGLPTSGAANKRYSRWKTKVQADLAKGQTAAAAEGDGDGEGESGDGRASPTKAKATPKKKAAGIEGKEGTPKKTPAKKSPVKKTPSKKRKIEEDAGEDEGDAVKAEGDGDDEL